MNHLDLFSGIGGFSLGLKKVFDIKQTFFSEIDKYAIDVFKYNFKYSKYVGSVTDIQGEQLPKINVITFGSPCQDFSMAGKRKGMDGQRSSLILEAIRLIKECRPDFFIWENVKGTFSSNSGSDFTAILKAFNDIGGYRLEWQLLNTKWFLPQNRERIYLVGCLGEGSGRQIFPISENNFKTVKLQRQQGNTCTLTTRYEAGGNGSYIIERELDAQEEIKINSATKSGYEIAHKGDGINFQNPGSKTKRGRVGKGISQTLDTSCSMAVIEAGTLRTHNHGKGFRKIKSGDSPAIPARARNDGSGQPVIKNKNKIRRLTPIECERLQGFPDDWTKYGKELGDISDTQRYKMCGNAVTVDVVEAVAKRIKLSVI